MNLKGRYILFPNTCDETIVENALIQDGLTDFLAMLFQGASTYVAPGANYYVGLCGANGISTTLATLSGEPTVTNGYARQSLARSSTGFPTVELLNGNGHVRSALVTFAATGAFSTSVTNLFLCSASAGTSGKLYSVSAAFPSAITMLAGATLPVQYDLYIN